MDSATDNSITRPMYKALSQFSTFKLQTSLLEIDVFRPDIRLVKPFERLESLGELTDCKISDLVDSVLGQSPPLMGKSGGSLYVYRKGLYIKAERVSKLGREGQKK